MINVIEQLNRIIAPDKRRLSGDVKAVKDGRATVLTSRGIVIADVDTVTQRITPGARVILNDGVIIGKVRRLETVREFTL